MIALNEFAHRHWDSGPDFTGARITTICREEFMAHVREFVSKHGGFDAISRPGYAPFCRHVFIPNFTDARADYVDITEENVGKIRSGYLSRRPGELPVLCRWICACDLATEVQRAVFLDLIFYSREQIKLETESFDKKALEEEEFDWGLISIKGQLVDYETPMMPITIMRNALGVEYGGSSDPIDPIRYQESIDFWATHISVK
jgi:hypothetical protein